MINLLLPAAALVSAAAPLYLVRFSVLGIPTTALEVLIYLFVAAVLVLAVFRRGMRPVPRRYALPVLLFLAAAVLSTIVAPDKRAALGILKAWIVDPILFGWAVWQLPEKERVSAALATGLTVGGVGVALVALYQRMIGQVTVDGRVIGPYAWSLAENASPNYLALYLGPIAVVAFGSALAHLPPQRRLGAAEYGSVILFTASFLLLLCAIVFSYSRGGLAAVGVGVAAVLVLRWWPMTRRRPASRAVLAGLATLALVAGMLAVRPDPSLSPEEGGRITASNNVRWEIWKTTLEVLGKPSPIGSLPVWVTGVGLGNYQDYFTDFTRDRVNYDRIAPLALTPHNFFLAVWVNLGLLGLAAVGWLLLVVFREGLHGVVVKSDRGRNVRFSLAPSIPLLGALAALLAHGLLDTPYFKNDLSLLFWTLVELVVLCQDGQQPDQRARSKGEGSGTGAPARWAMP